MSFSERALNKITSGQWLLTMACSIVFVWCSVTSVLSEQTIAAIISSVFTLYFRRDRQPDAAAQAKITE